MHTESIQSKESFGRTIEDIPATYTYKSRKEKGKMIATSSADEVDEDEIVEEELQAYIDHGAMVGG